VDLDSFVASISWQAIQKFIILGLQPNCIILAITPANSIKLSQIFFKYGRVEDVYLMRDNMKLSRGASSNLIICSCRIKWCNLNFGIG
jgi:hypothetical protein